MTAEQVLDFAETLRGFALHSSRDLNAANLYVHNMLMRAVLAEANDSTPPPETETSRAA